MQLKFQNMLPKFPCIDFERNYKYFLVHIANFFYGYFNVSKIQ